MPQEADAIPDHIAEALELAQAWFPYLILFENMFENGIKWPRSS